MPYSKVSLRSPELELVFIFLDENLIQDANLVKVKELQSFDLFPYFLKQIVDIKDNQIILTKWLTVRTCFILY